MECGRLKSGLRWSAYSSTSSELNIPSVVIEDACVDHEDLYSVNDKYLISFPDDESDVDSAYDTRERTIEEVDSENEPSKKLVNRFYDNPLFIPPDEVLKEAISVELMKGEVKKFVDYKFCEELEVEEGAFDVQFQDEDVDTSPVVYLSMSRAARLQRAFRLAGFRKVCFCIYI